MNQKMEIFTGAVCLLLFSTGLASAANPHNTTLNPSSTGRPSQNCQQLTPPDAFPGNTGNAPGSAFNGTAGTVYAGNGAPSLNNNSPNGVAAQYDVACFQQTQHQLP